MILAAADEQLASAGVAFGLNGREERGDLVAVVRLLLELGVLVRVAGDEEAYLRDTGDALYDVQRRVLAGVLAPSRGPSTIAASEFARAALPARGRSAARSGGLAQPCRCATTSRDACSTIRCSTTKSSTPSSWHI